MAATVLAGGVSYGIQQYQDYLAFLARLSRDFPWRGPERLFLGYNHSVMQTVLFFFGVTDLNKLLALAIKLLLLVPLAGLTFKWIKNPLHRAAYQAPRQVLELAFVFYAAVFIWLDMIWEVSMGMAVFVYLLVELKATWKKVLLWVVFLPYALVDVWRLGSYIIFGDDILYDGSYVLSDPLVYLPVILFVILAFYFLTLERLWKTPLNPSSAKAVIDVHRN